MEMLLSICRLQANLRAQKVPDILKKPWDVIAVDFSGPYSDGHYNLVAIDKRTRYPEVVKTHSTAFQPSKEKLKTLFATHGSPRQLESDKRPFNSRELAEFATTEGFHHHQVTQQHACANGKAESSTKLNIANAFIQDNTSKERDAEKNQPRRIGEKFC